jgi:hypothetical protein
LDGPKAGSYQRNTAKSYLSGILIFNMKIFDFKHIGSLKWSEICHEPALKKPITAYEKSVILTVVPDSLIISYDAVFFVLAVAQDASFSSDTCGILQS